MGCSNPSDLSCKYRHYCRLLWNCQLLTIRYGLGQCIPASSQAIQLGAMNCVLGGCSDLDAVNAIQAGSAICACQATRTATITSTTQETIPSTSAIITPPPSTSDSPGGGSECLQPTSVIPTCAVCVPSPPCFKLRILTCCQNNAISTAAAAAGCQPFDYDCKLATTVYDSHVVQPLTKTRQM